MDALRPVAARGGTQSVQDLRSHAERGNEKEIYNMGKYEWIFWVALAGLSWGTYVPLIFYGGSELVGKGTSGRFMAILCVGVAYFVIAVLFPLYMFLSKQSEWPTLTTTGLVFSGLAGVAGAIGALCVIFASKSAVQAAKDAGLDAATYRLYIAPLIFGLAPVINTIVSLLWHPQKGEPFHFHIDMPGWKLWVGIILVGVGAALVLFSKEEAEAHHPPAKAPAVTTAPAAQSVPEKSP
jgi:drug/metabolite transporter (DMT)-like permease